MHMNSVSFTEAQLINCKMSVLLFLLLNAGEINMSLLYSIVVFALAIVTLVTGQCTPGESRLVGGTSPRDGVMEICTVNGTWGTVCGYDFGCEEANVACRQLGFQNFCKSLYTVHKNSVKVSNTLVNLN